MNGPNETVKEKIERLQKWAWEFRGEDPATIPVAINLLRNRKNPDFPQASTGNAYSDAISSPIETDEEKLKHKSEIYNRFGTTLYQNPVALSNIASNYDFIVEEVRLYKPEFAHNLTTPLVATIPLLVLNGFAIKDNANNYGIVLQDGLLEIPFLFSFIFGPFVVTKSGNSFSSKFMKNTIKEDLKTNSHYINAFMKTLIMDISQPGISTPSKYSWDSFYSMPEDMQNLYNLIGYGFKFFILAHELAHCFRGHFQQIENKEACCMRPPELVQETLNRYKRTYSHLPPPDEDQVDAFRYLHALEMDADFTAFDVLIDYILKEDPNLNNGSHLLVLFGAYLFFWYLDWMEKTRRTIDVGERWLKDPLFFKDEIVGSLLYRPTHPAPLERARHIGFRIHQKFNGNPRLQQLFNVPGNWLAILFDLLWADNRQLIKLIRESKAKVHPKWVQSLPEIGIALGMNHGNKTVIY